ncbi:Carnitine transport ATP-binding protein OpuCA [compost metagenome]
MSDEIIVMKEGRILQKDTPEAIYRRPAHPFTARFIGKTNWLEVDKRLVRPEHVRWEPLTENDLRYSGVVQTVSYMGERYEITVRLSTGEVWMAYHPSRLRIGDPVQLYVSQEQIHVL